eukprot:TRINITY_DN3515_c0_g1_i1.p1 TRINITY_DN3515_c0_g1~~TRINITY_DN3515_c0_g1_i1.p1  ORF type:complete len:1049 (-),score=179.87 TRINITY_DN3515_c0_g1_i1:50-3172(-)
MENIGMRAFLLGLAVVAVSSEISMADSQSVQAVDWASLNATTLSQLPTSDFSSITSSQLGSIPPEACSGFSAAQVAAVSEYSWSGLRPAQLGNISADAFSGFSSTAIGNIRDWSQASAAQIANIPPAACAGFKSTTFNTVPSTAIVGFTADQVRNFDEYGACAIISAQQLSNFTAAAYGGFQVGCITKIPALSFVGATAAGVSQLTAAACGGFTSTKMQNLNPEAYSGLTPTCVGALTSTYSADACGGLSAAGFPLIPATAFAQISSSCIGISPKPSWAGATKEQVQTLTGTQCSGFNSGQMTYLSAAGYSGLSQDCVNKFSYTYSVDACAGLNATGLAAMAPAAFAGFTSGCLNLSPSGAFSLVTSEQISNLNAAACTGFSARAMQGLSAGGYAGLSAACVGNLPYTYTVDGCHGISSDGLASMTTAAFAGFTSGCLGAVPGAAFVNASAEQIANLSPAGCGGISKSVMVNLNPPAYGGFQSACLAQLPYTYSVDGCQGFSTAGFPYIQASQTNGINRGCMGVIPGSAFINATAAQIAGLSESGCSGMSKSQMANMNDAAYSGFQSACLAALPYTYSVDACAGFTASGTARIAPTQIGGIQRSCLSVAPSTTFSLASAELIAGLSASGCSGLTAGQMTNMNGSAYAGFTATCVTNFAYTYTSDACPGIAPAYLPNMTPAAFAGFTAGCVGEFRSGVVAAITVDQIKALPAASCVGFDYLWAMQPATFTAMSLAQISALSTYGISSLTGAQFVELLTRWGNELLLAGGWTQAQLSRPVLTSALYVKQAAVSGGVTRFVPLPTDWAAFSCKITWLHFALFSSDPASGWDADIIKTINSIPDQQCNAPKSALPSFAGMRADQAKNLTPNGAAALTDLQAQYLINDTVAAFGKDQWMALSPAAVGALSKWAWQNVTCAECISSLSAIQLAYMEQWTPLPCAVIGMFEQSQFGAVSSNSFAAYNLRRKACGLDAFVAPPQYIFPPDFVVAPSSSINGNPSAAPNPGSAPIGAIVGGVIAGFVLLGAVGGFLYWRRSRRSGYTSV